MGAVSTIGIACCLVGMVALPALPRPSLIVVRALRKLKAAASPLAASIERLD